MHIDAGKFPRRIEIELTNECNSHCSYCPRRFMKYKIGFMDFSLFRKLINEISLFPDRMVVLFRRGESILHPRFIDMLNYCKGKCRDIQIATNASVMNKEIAQAIAENATFVSFSIELPERYEQFRSLDYAKVLKNINYFLTINQKAKTQVSMVSTEDITAREIEEFKRRWINKVNRVRVYDEHSGDGNFGSLEKHPRERKACVKPFNDMLIFWDGKVGRCNHDWGEYPLDSVVDKTIQEVWLNPKYDKLREQHRKLIISDKVCSKCDSWYDKIGVCDVGKVYENETKK